MMEEEEKLLLLLFAIMVVVLRIHAGNRRLLTVMAESTVKVVKVNKTTNRPRSACTFVASPSLPMLPPFFAL